jgi:hypothetical protein
MISFSFSHELRCDACVRGIHCQRNATCTLQQATIVKEKREFQGKHIPIEVKIDWQSRLLELDLIKSNTKLGSVMKSLGRWEKFQDQGLYLRSVGGQPIISHANLQQTGGVADKLTQALR